MDYMEEAVRITKAHPAAQKARNVEVGRSLRTARCSAVKAQEDIGDALRLSRAGGPNLHASLLAVELLRHIVRILNDEIGEVEA